MIRPNNPGEWLKLFFEEKALDNRVYEVEAGDNLHILDTQTVISLIQQAPKHEQTNIMNMLIQIDYYNGDVHHFMEHLARCFAMTCYVKT